MLIMLFYFFYLFLPFLSIVSPILFFYHPFLFLTSATCCLLINFSILFCHQLVPKNIKHLKRLFHNRAMAHEIVLGRSESDFKRLGTKGAVFLGKQYVKMGQTTSLSNPIYLDIIGAHVVFVCGKRGGGKCLHGESIITLDDGSQVPIKDLEQHNGDIFSLNQDFKIEQARKSYFYKRNVSKLLKIKLRSGKEIKLTPEHPLLTVRGWAPVEQLSLGSRIATPRTLGTFGEGFLTEPEIKLLAYLLAEGHLANNFVLFSNMDKTILDDFKRAVYHYDASLQVKTHSKDGCYRVVGNRRRTIIKQADRDSKGRFSTKPIVDGKSSLRKWLDTLGIYGKLAHEKFFPGVIFNLPKNKLSLFLNRLFSCDGTIYKEGTLYWKIAYCSSSAALIQQLHHLLLRYGVISRIRLKKTRKLDDL